MRCRALKIVPILECVRPCGDGEFTADFGYRNDEGRIVVIPAGGADNFFRPSPRVRGQPTRFFPGRHHNVFSVHGSSELVWSLAGHTAKARRNFAACEEDFAATDAPLALLPVRIETRFFPFGQTPTELLVRIYPDDIHVDTHEPELTDEELAFGTAFWKNFSVEGSDAADQKRRQAWALLADHFGPRRAAWIAKVTAPGAPAPPHRSSSWTRAASTNVLPTRWFALGYRGDQRIFAVSGKKVPATLAVGPSPNAAPGEGESEPELLWLRDFDEAVKVGMAIRVPLSGDTTLGFDRVMVVGSKGGCDREQGAAFFQALLDAHHYTDGLSVLPQGVPTNNTDEEPSGFASKDPGQGRSFAAERVDRLFQPGDGHDGDVLTNLLGIDDRTLAHVEGAGGLDDQDAKAMNTVLWETTLGYFFKQMVSPLASPGEIAAVRRHFIDHVRARGPLPVIRIGRQPYGLLPTTSLDRLRALAPGAAASPGFSRARAELVRLRGLWRASLDRVPRVGTASDASVALEQLVQVLSMEPVSTKAEGRFVFGKEYLTLNNDFLGAWKGLGGIFNFFFSAEEYFELVRSQLLARIQLPLGSRLLGATYAPEPFALEFALTGVAGATLEEVLRDPSGEVSKSDPYPTATNVFTAVRSLDAPSLRQFTWANLGAGTTALLPRLVRDAKLLEYAAASASLQAERGLLDRRGLFEPEFVDARTGTTRTLGRLLDDSIADVTGTSTVANFFDRLTPSTTPLTVRPHLAGLFEYLGAAGYLEKRPTAAIDLAFREHFDLCSHRVDAWVTSMATGRLKELRSRRAKGLYLGGYGWVEDVRPSIRQRRTEGGFVLAPSLNHAVTAAILRNGRVSHNASAVDAAFAVDLSSRRVRRALALVEGIRQGNSLGALLGYELQRTLKENHPGLFFEAVFSRMRAIAPLVANKIDETQPVDPNAPIEDLGARNVVDGVRFRDLFHSGTLASFLSTLTADQRTALQAEIANLDDIVDAVSDLTLAESVYQLARGNHPRASAVMDAFGRVEALPPDFQVVSTPRTGTANTHRLLVLFSGDASAVAGWPASSLRASAEPHLNAWAGKLLGDPQRVEARAEFLHPTGEALVPPITASIKLSELPLAPLDVLDVARPGEAGAPSDLERLMAARLLKAPSAGVPAGAAVRFDLGRDPTWSADRLSVGELFELARRARETIADARATTPSDLTTPDDRSASGFDVDEMKQRADVASGALSQATLALAAIDVDAATLTAIASALSALFPFGIPGAIPAPSTGVPANDRDAFKRQIPFVLAQAQRRVAALDALAADFDPAAGPEASIDFHIRRINAVFGPHFRVLPRIRPDNVASLADAIAEGAKTEKATPFAALTWFQRAARVRDGASRLDDVLFYAETLATGDAPNFRILQLPARAGDAWIGLPTTAGTPPLVGRVSIVAHAPNGLDMKAPIAGLTIDEWMDVIPSPRETAAVSFQYDRPNSTAPQSILLAVTPVPQSLWDLDTLEAVLLETIDLARIRAVDPHTVRGVGHVLPALFFAHNLSADTIGLRTELGT